MGKNYMPEVARMLGVEINEEFDVFLTEDVESSVNPYKFTGEKFVNKDGDEMKAAVLGRIIYGRYTLQKRPWRPKYGEKYWFVYTNETIYSDIFYKENVYCFAILSMGNCFPSKEAAEAAKPEMLAKFKKIKKGARE